MDILYFQGVRPFRLGGEALRLPRKPKRYAQCNQSAGTIMDILYFQVLTLWWGRKTMDILTSKRGFQDAAPATGRGTIMDILYFQGVGLPSALVGYDPLSWRRRMLPGHANEGSPRNPCMRPYARLNGGAPNACACNAKRAKGLQVLHLPRKTSRRGSKCCACHANRSGAQCNQSLPDFRGPL